jgi:hypothetical protein
MIIFKYKQIGEITNTVVIVPSRTTKETITLLSDLWGMWGALDEKRKMREWNQYWEVEMEVEDCPLRRGR